MSERAFEAGSSWQLGNRNGSEHLQNLYAELIQRLHTRPSDELQKRTLPMAPRNVTSRWVASCRSAGSTGRAAPSPGEMKPVIAGQAAFRFDL